eukprot:scaffold946_cov359-Pavlova_lutheri.AAC.2
MADCRSVSSPMEPGSKLTSDEDIENTDFLFQELAGYLMYLVVSTRPDIANATNCLARFVTCVEAAPALVRGRSNPLGTTTEFRSSTFEEYGRP